MAGDYISVKEASEKYGLSVAQIGRLLRLGKLQGRKIGNSWAVVPTSVELYLADRPKPGLKKGQKIHRKGLDIMHNNAYNE